MLPWHREESGMTRETEKQQAESQLVRSLDEAATPTPFTQEEARPLAWATGATGASCHLQSELGPSSFQKVLPENIYIPKDIFYVYLCLDY